MKKPPIVVAFIVLIAMSSLAQTSPYMVGYFSNNPGPSGAADQQIRLINFGATGTPLTSPTGDVCANVYVFDANQEMVACCSCRITPNGLVTLAVGSKLTNNPLTSVVPVNGDIKIVSTAAVGATRCTASNYNGGILNSTTGSSTHLQTSGGTIPATFMTETNLEDMPVAIISDGAEGQFLALACQFARYLGSGKGTCTCAS